MNCDPSGSSPAPNPVDYEAMWRHEAEKFQAETLTTSFLAGLLREAEVKCQRCSQSGRVVVVSRAERAWVCDICVARTPEFTARLAERMERDRPILDRLADDRPIRVKDTSKWPPREKP
jgi:hypothetical protein